MDAILSHPVFAYFLYILSSFVLLGIFSLIYTKITRYNEWALIRSGNTAAAISYAGALIGFCLTLFTNIISHQSWELFLLWSLVAMGVQIVTYAIVSLVLFKGVNRAITNNNTAKGILMGSFSLSVGIINAACIL